MGGIRFDVVPPPPSQSAPTTSTTLPAGGPDSLGAVATGGVDAISGPDAEFTQSAETRLRRFREAYLSGGNPALTTIPSAIIRIGSGGGITRVGDPNGPGTPGQSMTVTALLAEAAKYGREQIEALQSQLYEAGFYSQEVYNSPERLRMGGWDPDTRKAFHRLLSEAIVQERPVADVLGDGFQSFSEGLGKPDEQRAGQVGGGSVYQQVLSDPAALDDMVTTVSKAVLGRDVDDNERQSIVATIRAAQAAEQAQAGAAQEGQRRAGFDAQVSSAAASAGAKITQPVPGGTFGQSLGASRGGGTRLHEGVDIMAERGAPVVAAASGTIKFVRSGGSGGLRIEIDGDDGRTYRYMHLNSTSVESGRVEAGQQIGAVGTSGNAEGTTPHLHFEVRQGSTPLEPIGLIAASSAPVPGTPSSSDTYLPPVTVTTEQVDPQGRAQEMIEVAHAPEAEAYDQLNAYRQFRQFITSGSLATAEID